MQNPNSLVPQVPTNLPPLTKRLQHPSTPSPSQGCCSGLVGFWHKPLVLQPSQALEAPLKGSVCPEPSWESWKYLQGCKNPQLEKNKRVGGGLHWGHSHQTTGRAWKRGISQHPAPVSPQQALGSNRPGVVTCTLWVPGAGTGCWEDAFLPLSPSCCTSQWLKVACCDLFVLSLWTQSKHPQGRRAKPCLGAPLGHLQLLP